MTGRLEPGARCHCVGVQANYGRCGCPLSGHLQDDAGLWRYATERGVECPACGAATAVRYRFVDLSDAGVAPGPSLRLCMDRDCRDVGKEPPEGV